MARPMRIEYDGAVYHVTSRGNARKAIYKDTADRENFLEVLRKVNIRYNWLCHVYCLMNNHYHLVIETPDGNLSRGMRQLNGVYTQLLNKRHNRVGHIFQGRYKAILIQKETHLLEVCRYVVINPVRARSVQKPEDWLWSSYCGTMGIGKAHPAVTTDWILGQFGTRRKEAQRRYRAFVEAGIGRKGIWEEVRGQSLLGEAGFAENLMGYLKGQQDIREIPRSQRFADRPSLLHFFTSEITNRKDRDRKIIEAVERHAYSQREVADHLGLHYTTVSRIMNEPRG
jgi:REP element-mobilizing transposase RayT